MHEWKPGNVVMINIIGSRKERVREVTGSKEYMATRGLFKQSWPTNFSMNQKKDNDKEVNGLLRHSRYILKNHLVLVWELMTGNWMKLRMENSPQIYLIYLHPYLYIHTYMYLWKGFSANTEELVGLVVLFIVFGAQAAIFFCWQFFFVTSCVSKHVAGV